MSNMMVTIKYFNDRFEANVSANKLEANGIQSYIHHQDSVIVDPGTFSAAKIELKVAAGDVERAIDVLNH